MTTADKDSKGGIASWLVGEHELPTVDDNEQPVVEKPVVEEKPAPKKRGRKAKQTQPVVDDSNESSSPEAAAAPAPAPKKTTKIIKKVVKKKTPEPQPINPDDCQEIEIERDGTEVTLLLHEQTQMVYDTDNLLHPIGKVDDDGIEFF
jgi:hypothetical protein